VVDAALERVLTLEWLEKLIEQLQKGQSPCCCCLPSSNHCSGFVVIL
jgi:hypothetical protein